MIAALALGDILLDIDKLAHIVLRMIQYDNRIMVRAPCRRYA